MTQDPFHWRNIFEKICFISYIFYLYDWIIVEDWSIVVYLWVLNPKIHFNIVKLMSENNKSYELFDLVTDAGSPVYYKF